MTYTIKAKSFPDLAKQFQAFKLRDELENEVFKSNSLIGNSIRHALVEKKPLKTIFKEIKEMAQDNPSLMRDELGEELLNKIINF